MGPKFFKRFSAFSFDISLLGLVGGMLHVFIPAIPKNFAFMLLMLKLDHAQIIPWISVLSLFILVPLPLFFSFLFMSASPGQLIQKIRELDDIRGHRIDAFQAFILSYTFLPSIIFFNGLPQVYATLNREERTLLQCLSGTKSRPLNAVDKQAAPMKRWFAGLLIVLCSFGSLFVFSKILFHSTIRSQGIAIGGTVQERVNIFLAQKKEEKKPRNTRPEICFEALRVALKSKDEKALLQQVSTMSQLALTAFLKEKVDFEDLPEDMQWVRTESSADRKSMKIYYRAIENNTVSQKEEVLSFVKEGKEWKLDLMPFIKQNLQNKP